MNVYIASFMLLLFNAVGVNTPATAMTAETAGNETASEVERATSSDWDKATWAFATTEEPFIIAFSGSRETKPVWAVLPTQSTIGDKLEHEEGAP
ncbi:hypothetical protein [Parasphingorhabdus cellanae]|uniref:Uncharacterized protein n=1 Tax=Parasphingorhabdus cellanae TaxID=2806553 RepID=A0ABX7T5M1_9SPHN|nr:hypothetical protein [Parasphingorhabdus cellanae]QTD56120.1 hypothetical protein J4G78_00470 [Parasphingorhabdus cellanae]